MKRVLAHVVESTGSRLGGFSLRDEHGSASGFKQALEVAGFKAGDTVAIVEAAAGASVGDLDLDAIEARAKAATAGPWAVKWPLPPPPAHSIKWPTIVHPVPATGDEVDDDDLHVTDLDDCIEKADAEFIAAARSDVPDLVAAVRELIAEVGAQFSLDGIRTAALALPVDDRHRLRAELAATLPLPSCYVPVPALLAHEAGKMTLAEVETLIGLLTKRRPS